METKDETKIMARLLRVFRKNLLVLLTVVGVVVGLAVGFGIRETIPSQDAILWIGECVSVLSLCDIINASINA